MLYADCNCIEDSSICANVNRLLPVLTYSINLVAAGQKINPVVDDVLIGKHKSPSIVVRAAFCV